MKTRAERNEYHREWKRRNRDKTNARARELRKSNPNWRATANAYREANKERLNAAERARYERELPLNMLKRAKKRAERKGLDFTVTLADIEIPATCPVLGVTLAPSQGGKPSDNSPSLDRIDNSKGYVPGNVLVVSWRANRIKCDATVEELRAVVSFYEKLL